MIYEYRCNPCKLLTEVVKSVKEIDKDEYCFKCGKKMKRLISMPFRNIDGSFWAEHLDDQPVWIKNRRHYKEELRKRGLIDSAL